MIFLGSPCSEKTQLWYKVAIPYEVTVAVVGMKNDFFVNLSTITRMVSKPLDSGKGHVHQYYLPWSFRYFIGV